MELNYSLIYNIYLILTISEYSLRTLNEIIHYLPTTSRDITRKIALCRLPFLLELVETWHSYLPLSDKRALRIRRTNAYNYS